MNETISEQQVRHVAKLARLKLNDDEVRMFTRQLGDILSYVEKLNELDTDNVEPTAHAAPLKNVFREDKAKEGIGVEAILKNAPSRDGSFFTVPKVLGDSSA
jgi:aspartyl-tRNA(Asn)/glutamyl-tRNA(Gln) amidotransferase subunit C